MKNKLLSTFAGATLAPRMDGKGEGCCVRVPQSQYLAQPGYDSVENYMRSVGMGCLVGGNQMGIKARHKCETESIPYYAVVMTPKDKPNWYFYKYPTRVLKWAASLFINEAIREQTEVVRKQEAKLAGGKEELDDLLKWKADIAATKLYSGKSEKEKEMDLVNYLLSKEIAPLSKNTAPPLSKKTAPIELKQEEVAPMSQRERTIGTIYSFGGESLTLHQWAAKMGVKTSILRNRLNKYGWSVEDTLSVKVKPRPSRRKKTTS